MGREGTRDKGEEEVGGRGELELSCEGKNTGVKLLNSRDGSRIEGGRTR